MQPWEIILLVVAALAVAAIGWWAYDRRRSQRLQRRYGPEYDRAISNFGSRRRAEADLAQREVYGERLRNRPMNAAERAQFVERWQLCQQRFVDDPTGAVEDADDLLLNVMRVRGYRVDNPNDRMLDLAAAYSEYVDGYRHAGEIVARERDGDTSTDALRQAFLYYKTFFDELLGVPHEKSQRAA